MSKATLERNMAINQRNNAREIAPVQQLISLKVESIRNKDKGKRKEKE